MVSPKMLLNGFTVLDQVEEFFVSYNKQRNKKFRIQDVGGPKKAFKFLKAGMQSFTEAHKEQ